MSEDEIALLKALAVRPTHTVVDSLQPLVDALLQAGLVSSTPSGWMATPQGCEVVAQASLGAAARGAAAASEKLDQQS